MFTGIVEIMGRVSEVAQMDTTASGGSGFSITIADCAVVLTDVHLGDSIAVNGTCLTVTEFDSSRSWFKVNVAPESLRKTNLGQLQVGSKVNLERAMSATTRFGGHFVQGHVDTVVTIHQVTPDPPNSVIYTFKVASPAAGSDADFLTYIIPKGYVTLDGTSLTVIDVDLDARTFTVMLIPHTLKHVIMPLKAVGDQVNLEVDQIGKYVENIVERVLSRPGSTAFAGIEALVERVVERKLGSAGQQPARQ
ncbi:uncharacterized protein BJ171DRAFT_582788 [Polychytrium aggregatum]|uniref:uncharacterized protein n=1 Tax=Polychytrium aggregatum TaxID=110093 RepID=UPI0022FE28C1|nr:uncharacterized protein BJ171DRAFT_582788 [Polychytrium aggregatum]KAI9203644.1 hypothetical protein BJ171DRAFT_582788 [Polychytrium aggregatum]